jgi:thiol-disulfide isomerase/thioredoxin
VSSSLAHCALFFFLTTSTSAARLGVDLQGNDVQHLTSSDTRVVVLFFAASECPVSNRYAPEITQLQRKFNSRQVSFWWVFPNPEDTSDLVREHQRQFSIEGNTILDTEHALVQMAHVTTTPESAVFTVNNGHLHEVYHGEVDDRYLSIGQERPRPTHHDLEEAIAATLNGKPVSRPVTHAVGCSIMPLTTASR